MEITILKMGLMMRAYLWILIMPLILATMKVSTSHGAILIH